MDRFMIVPGRPVADHEVNVKMPTHSNHRRQRHAPLLRATEWMKAMYYKKDCHPMFKNELEIIGEGGEAAELPSKEVRRSLGPTSAERRRGMIYTPQVIRPRTSTEKRDMTGITFESFLEQLDCPSAKQDEVDVCNDGEVSPINVSRPLFGKHIEGENQPVSSSGKTQHIIQARANPADRLCDVPGTPTVIYSKRWSDAAIVQSGKAAQSSRRALKNLPAVPTDNHRLSMPLATDIQKRSTPNFQIARKALPAPSDKVVQAPQTSPQVMKFVQVMAETAKGTCFPPIDYGPVGKHTALQSHRPSEKELQHSMWLSEGWKLWKSGKVAYGSGGANQDRGKRSVARMVTKPLRGAVKGFFTRG